MVKSLLAFLLITYGSFAEARPVQEITLQPRALAMGGAAVGLADDEYALFNNAAGLAGQTKRQFKLVNLSFEGSADTYTTVSTSLDTFKNFKTSDLNKLMGKDIALRGGFMPMITLPNFAIAYVVDAQGAMNQFNQANPYFDLTDMITHGVQAGVGWELKHGKRAQDIFKIGFAAKVLWRRGGTYTVSTAGLLQATSDGKAYINNLVGSYGMGFGGDLGFQYVHKIDKQSQYSLGASVTDVFGTHFSDPHAATLPESSSLGIGYKRDFKFMQIALDFDLRHLEDRIAFSSKTHFGADFTFPILDVYLGLNQLNPTYGLGFDLWVLKMTVLSYAEELGIYYHQNFSRRYMLQAEFDLPI